MFWQLQIQECGPPSRQSVLTSLRLHRARPPCIERIKHLGLTAAGGASHGADASVARTSGGSWLAHRALPEHIKGGSKKRQATFKRE